MNPGKDLMEKIEDVIDERKEKGQYNIPFPSEQKASCRFAYSTPTRYTDDKALDVCSWNVEGDMNDGRDSTANNIGPTDSEITVLRVKMDNSFMKTAPANNWNMRDDAIPGDGTHLGESPSLVNLATLVVHSKDCYQEATACAHEGREYLVPLSSWEPSDKRQNSNDVELQSDTVTFENVLNESEHSSSFGLPSNHIVPSEADNEKKVDIEIIKSPSKIGSKTSFAGRVTKFIRKHLTAKKKELTKPESQETSNSASLEPKEKLASDIIKTANNGS